ncbi:primosomal protein DnaI [Aureibacillus halotolerans]|uniref:Primosomal protein DnaI n=1 Tax=Aureibacillus halotolerans TaxID=1508390 RepID=A0A4R6U0G8_9BACI|nr:primosomal protein DnaI [Aureibacillus halotolerans]TDQ39156.1 primosomal protein DnaI [Aureibacillus halotolerans]
MKPIQDSLRKWGSQSDLQKQLQQLKENVLSHQEIRSFIDSHQLTNDIVERHLMLFYEYTTQQHSCNSCSSVDQCINVMKGYLPKLVYTGTRIEIRYEKCDSNIRESTMKKQQSLVQGMAIPDEVLNATMSDLDTLELASKRRAVSLAVDFIDQYKSSPPPVGLYIHGSFGTGKTYLLGAVANELKSRYKASSLLLFVPEFIRQCKESLGNDSLARRVQAVQEAEVLMLDDLGAESMSSWMRDEVLGPIFQYRMMHKRPTFISSNLGVDELLHHFSYSQRGEHEQLKAMRIMERIRTLTIPVELTGKNRRDKK